MDIRVIHFKFCFIFNVFFFVFFLCNMDKRFFCQTCTFFFTCPVDKWIFF